MIDYKNKIKYLLLPLFVLGLFFVLKPIKVNADNDTILYSGGDWTRSDNVNNWVGLDNDYHKNFIVPESCANPILIYNNNSIEDNIEISSIYVSKDDISLTGVHSQKVFSAGYNHNSGYYLLESGAGYEIGFQGVSGKWHSFNFDIFCNVDPDDPVYYSLTKISSSSKDTIPEINSGNSGNMWYIGGNNVTSNFAYTTYNSGYAYPNINYKSQYDLASNFTTSFDISYNSGYYGLAFSIYNLNYKQPVIVPNTDSIYIDSYYKMAQSYINDWSSVVENVYYRNLSISPTCANPYLLAVGQWNDSFNININDTDLNYIVGGDNNKVYGLPLIDFSNDDLKLTISSANTSLYMVLCNVDPVNSIDTDIFSPVYAVSAYGNPSSYNSPNVIIENGDFFFGAVIAPSVDNFAMSIDNENLRVGNNLKAGFFIGDDMTNQSWNSRNAWYETYNTTFILNVKEPVSVPVINYNVSFVDNWSFTCNTSDFVTLNYNFCSSYSDIKQFKVALYDFTNNLPLFSDYYYILLQDKQTFIGSQQCKGSIDIPVSSAFLFDCNSRNSQLYLDVAIDYYDESEQGYSTFLSNYFYTNYSLNSDGYFLKFNKNNYTFKNQQLLPDQTATSSLSIAYDFCDLNDESILDDNAFYVYFTGNYNGVATSSLLFGGYDISESGCSNFNYDIAIGASYLSHLEGWLAIVGYVDDVAVYGYTKFLLDYIPLNADYLENDDFKAFDGFLKFLSGYFDGLISPLSRLFPFNFITILPNAWERSVINDKTSIPIISVNENNNIYLDLPVGNIEIFGNEFFHRDDRVSVFFDYVKSFIGLLLSAFYFLVIYNFGVMVYNKISGDNVGMLSSSSFSFEKKKQKVNAKAVIIKNKKNVKIKDNKL